MFLGRFSADSVRLSLDGLPPHARTRITFDLYIIQSWDGNSPGDGPDVLEVRVDRGPRLLYSSFSNQGPSQQQSYPGTYGVDAVPAQTGSAAVNTLGYSFGTPMDSTYHITRTFAHQDKSLTLVFSGLNLQGVADESWGLNNVKVEVLDAPREHLELKRIDEAWAALAEDDATKAMEGASTINEWGDDAVREIRRQLAAADAAKRDEKQLQQIQKLIADLDADKFQTRELATAELKRFGDAAVVELATALTHASSYELRSRIQEILDAQNSTPSDAVLSAATRRQMRLIQALELIGTPLAKAMLRDMGASYLEGRQVLREAATSALARLDGKSDSVKAGNPGDP